MAEQHQEDWELRWELLVADVWADPALKKRLLKDPAAVLKERGISPPKGVQVQVHEETDAVMHLVIPTKPAEGELSEKELETVAGGHCGGYGGCGCRGCGGCGCRGDGGCRFCRGCRGC